MEFQILTRSTALNNIPAKKVQEKLSGIIKGCEVCVKRDLKFKSAFDGLCPKCAIINIAFNRYSEANIPIEYWDLKMEKDFKGYHGLKSKYEELVADLKFTYINGISICFAGPNGTGKSLTSTCILKKACQKGFNCLYTDMSSIVSVLTQSPPEEKYLARRELILVDFLVIDELDPKFFSGSDAANELFAKNFENVFRTRKQNKLPTIICTNSPNLPESFKGLNKQSLSSLFAEIQMFFVIGEDFRKKSKDDGYTSTELAKIKEQLKEGSSIISNFNPKNDTQRKQLNVLGGTK